MGPVRSRSAIPSTAGGRLYVVHSYDAARQTVDVVAKDDPDAGVVEGVRIADGGDPSCLSFGRSFKSIQKHGAEAATVGYLVYPESDTGGGLLDRIRRRNFSGRRFVSKSPLFLATFRTDIDALPATFDATDEAGTNPNVIGPNDEWVASRHGALLVFKANGDIVHRYPGTAYFFGRDQVASNAKNAIRVGDTGDGGPAAGAISGPGTSRVRFA
jgi:hypothetical protein